MQEKQSHITVWGSLLGVLLLGITIYAAVQYYEAGLPSNQTPGVAVVSEKKVAPTNQATATKEPEPVSVPVPAADVLTDTQRSTTITTTALAESTAITSSTILTDDASGTKTPGTETLNTEVVSQTTNEPSIVAEQPANADTLTGTVTETTSAVTTDVITTGTLTTATNSSVVASPPKASDEVVAAINKAGCAACHTIAGVPAAVGVIGPNLSAIGTDGATRKPGYSAEQYIRESILTPNEFLAPKCPTGTCMASIMPQNFAQTLTADEIDTIVGYLVTLQSGK